MELSESEVKNKELSLKSGLILWLFAGCFLIFGMVVVGGITRLTGSGLSITEWKVVTGAIPPLNEKEWNEAFDKYKQIPQYQVVNLHFTLRDFKYIFFWEYIHRLFGRLIGVVFLGGFIYFLKKKAISKELMPKLLLMFVLGGIQGFLGWYMVSSGLSENIRVSHLRLAIHLTFAFITFGYIFYIALTQLYPEKINKDAAVKSFNKQGSILLFMIIVQIIYGAFVAGTKAGWTYNTWPKMGDEWIASSIPYAWVEDGISSLWNNLATVQFIHRMLAYVVAGFITYVFVKARKSAHLNPAQKKATSILFALVLFQIILGIGTLVMNVPIWMGVMHQATAFFLFAASIYFIQRLKFN